MAGWGFESLQHLSSSAVLALTGLGFGLALAPVNAALLASTDDAVHGVTSALLVVSRMVGMLVGISALTTIGLRRYYAVEAGIPSPNDVCGGGKTRCAAYTRLIEQAGIEQLQAIFLGAAVCAVVAAVPRWSASAARHARHTPTGAWPRHSSAPRPRSTGSAPGMSDLTFGPTVAVTDHSTTCSPPNREFARDLRPRRVRRRRPRGHRHRHLHGLADRPAADARALHPGDAKIFRNPGGRVTPQALEALVLGVHLLRVERILVIPHTRCAMASRDPGGAAGAGRRVRRPGRLLAALRRGRRPGGGAARRRRKVRSHPLIPDTVAVGGFLYDVDTGLLDQLV